MSGSQYINALESTGKLSEPAIRKAIKMLNLRDNFEVLDVPCGTGSHMKWMLQENPKLKITGFDIAEGHIEFAKQKLDKEGLAQSCEFVTGDINKLGFANNTFDLIWCCDGLWPGPKEMGCPAAEPYSILSEMVRVTKPGGKIAILFWTSQKLLPGYPILEATLNATNSALIRANPSTSPELHFMNTPSWLSKVGTTNFQTRTFAADITFPKNEAKKQGMQFLFEMFWGQSEQEVTREVWENYNEIINPESEQYILNNKNYAGFLTYTMFTGEVQK